MFDMINLSEDNLLAIGKAREVYVHPEDKNLCIKVDILNANVRDSQTTQFEIDFF